MRADRGVIILCAMLAGAQVPGCAALPAVDAQPAVHAPPSLAAVKARVMSADYRADLGELARLRDVALAASEQAARKHLAHYWSGFASWRMAINGASRGMDNASLKAHLERAASEFDAAIGQKDDFADGHAAAALTRSWLAGFLRDDAAAVRAQQMQSSRLLARARQLAPDNPRVLWAQGAALLYTPVEFGGNPKRAVETYRQMARAARAAGPADSAQPDWGEPEAHMSLAYSLMSQAVPDLDAAAAEAEMALRLQPAWSYVRDILIPQIEEARRKRDRAPG